MPTYEMGNIVFESVRLIDRAPGIEYRRLLEYDCFPPPHGTKPLVETFNPTSIGPRLVRETVQEDELRRLLEGARGDATSIDLADVLSAIAGPLTLRSAPIRPDYIPASARQIVPCYKTTIVAKIAFDQVEVTAKAKADVTLDGVFYPAGDTVATFRVLSPVFVTYLRWYEFNPRCCEEPTPEQFRPLSEVLGDDPPLAPERPQGVDLSLPPNWDYGLRPRDFLPPTSRVIGPRPREEGSEGSGQ
jgi:hypothetical protein